MNKEEERARQSAIAKWKEKADFSMEERIKSGSPVGRNLLVGIKNGYAVEAPGMGKYGEVESAVEPLEPAFSVKERTRVVHEAIGSNIYASIPEEVVFEGGDDTSRGVAPTPSVGIPRPRVNFSQPPQPRLKEEPSASTATEVEKVVEETRALATLPSSELLELQQYISQILEERTALQNDQTFAEIQNAFDSLNLPIRIIHLSQWDHPISTWSVGLETNDLVKIEFTYSPGKQISRVRYTNSNDERYLANADKLDKDIKFAIKVVGWKLDGDLSS
jgi:hypothetical protein